MTNTATSALHYSRLQPLSLTVRERVFLACVGGGPVCFVCGGVCVVCGGLVRETKRRQCAA